MMKAKKSNLDWMIEQNRQEKAGMQADDVVQRLHLPAPVDPFKIAESEKQLLRVGGRNFGNRYDGKLEYNRPKKRFLLFYNSKYDTGYPPGKHHPRTRFSISHELGHYFLDHHHAYLVKGGKPHASSSEFRAGVQIEREADAFAASLLLPTHLVQPLVDDGDFTLERLDEIAGKFEASLVSTAFRYVRLSNLPCAVVGIRDGIISWLFPSDPLVKAGCYPGESSLRSPTARSRWKEFETGVDERITADGTVSHWFQTYDRDYLDLLSLTEQYLPVRSMDTLVVVLTMDEDDVFPGEDDEGADE
jgi:Zn-dependent peptidase ImmA (M78 family)